MGVALSISNNHIQITYYLFILCLFIYIGYLVWKIKEKDWTELGKVTGIMVVCAVLAVLPGAKGLYSNWELGQQSIRGASELTPKPNADGTVEKKSTGLDKDYAFAWSYGKMELLTTLIPNAYGGGSGGMLGEGRKRYTGTYVLGRQELYFGSGLLRSRGLLPLCPGNVCGSESDEMVVVCRRSLHDITGTWTESGLV